MIDLEPLPWLPAMDASAFRVALTSDKAKLASAVEEQITTALDHNSLLGLHSAVKRNGITFPDYHRIKLGVTGHGTLDYLNQAITVSGWRHRLAIESVQSDYNQVMIDSLNPASTIRTIKCNFLLVWLDSRVLLPQISVPAKKEAPESLLEEIWSGLETMLSGFADSEGSPKLMVTNLVAYPEHFFGSSDVGLEGTTAWYVENINQRLRIWLSDKGHSLIDIASWAAWVGVGRWSDQRNWYGGRVLFAFKWLPFVGDLVSRTISRLSGHVRKCLVLDLDNTLWRGVIGDDGVDAIEVGEGSAEGEAHLSIQRYAKALRERGVVLAVCSKNDRETAIAGINDHPNMLLREGDIAVVEANWDSKPSNIRAIAEKLNIGTDSLVFLDDNPAERIHVRAELPEVAVPEVGAEAAYYVAICQAAGYFETERVTDDDLKRADFYGANAKRAKAKAEFTDLSSYLRSLEMRMIFGEVTLADRDRAVQLLNRSNQFNLTTRRFNENEFALLSNDSEHKIFCAKLSDKWGDNGLISVVVVKMIGDRWEITDWVMSCRVINRGVEEEIFNQLSARADEVGAQRIDGIWKKTPKNTMVAGLYSKLGFECKSSCFEDEKRYVMSVSTFDRINTAIDIEA